MPAMEVALNYPTHEMELGNTTVVRVAMPEGAVAHSVSAVQPSSQPCARLLDPGDPEVPVAVVEVGRAARRLRVSYTVQRLDGSRRFRHPAQAYEHRLLLRGMVVNPEAIDLPGPPDPAEAGVEYLVLTDGYRWDPDTIERLEPVAGHPVAEFGRLAAWKRSRGLTARVVTVDDVVEGRYGDFGARDSWRARTARDLPEVVRDFLKHVREAWGTRWVLLGGDTSIVPARTIDGIETDFYYASLSGPRWHAHVSVGRAVVSDGAGAAAWVDGALAYEQEHRGPGHAEAYQKRLEAAGGEFAELFRHRLATTRHLGLLADSRCELLHTAGMSTEATAAAILSLNLEGDPEQPVQPVGPRQPAVLPAATGC
jgi:hypothetical protein